jgi:hypothetical protein
VEERVRWKKEEAVRVPVEEEDCQLEEGIKS